MRRYPLPKKVWSTKSCQTSTPKYLGFYLRTWSISFSTTKPEIFHLVPSWPNHYIFRALTSFDLWFGCGDPRYRRELCSWNHASFLTRLLFDSQASSWMIHKVYEPQTRARLGIAAHSCEVAFPSSYESIVFFPYWTIRVNVHEKSSPEPSSVNFF